MIEEDNKLQCVQNACWGDCVWVCGCVLHLQVRSMRTTAEGCSCATHTTDLSVYKHEVFEKEQAASHEPQNK